MTPRQLLRFWIVSTLLCGINGFLAYVFAPPVRGADATYVTPLAGLTAGMLCALGATLLVVICALIKNRRRAPGRQDSP